MIFVLPFNESQFRARGIQTNQVQTMRGNRMTIAKLRTKQNLPFVISVTFFGINAICALLLLCFGFEGAVGIFSWLVLFILSLPWSFVAIVLSWGVFTGSSRSSGDKIFTLILLIFAGINALIIYWLSQKAFKQDSDESA